MGNIGILILGAVLIIAVLFIGYKMDTAAEKAPKMKAPKKQKAQKNKTKVKEMLGIINYMINKGGIKIPE